MLRNLVVSIVVGLFVMAHSPAHAVCKCCDDGWAPGMLSFETGIGGGLCGQMRNFSCEGANPDLLKHACVDSGDCYLGPCITTPGFCEQDYSVTCAEDSDCAGACVEQTSGGFPIDLTCGRLYAGGGLNIVPLPLMLPDGQQHFLKVEACPHRSVMELGPATRISVGEHHCTEGRKCSAGSDNPGDPCVVHGDCPNGTCEDRCFFGPPLPIPNAVTTRTSVCVIRAVAEDPSGTAQCEGGAMNLDMPLRWVIHVQGDLLNEASPPNVPGVQACPLCSKVCVGGDNAGFPCVDDSDCGSNDCTESEQCLAGPNDGLPCTPETSRLDVHKCCAHGWHELMRCNTDADCASGAPRCELSFYPCADDSDCVDQPNDHCIRCVPGCTSFPTSHDCPPDPAMDITWRTGGLPIDFNLTTGTITKTATDLSTYYGRRVFCGYCRDVTGVGSLCFEGDLFRPGCPAAIPPADGNAVPCTSNADCQANRCLDGVNRGAICADNSDCPGGTCVVDDDEYETCSQNGPGAFSKTGATQITVTGGTNGGCLADEPSYDADLVGFYCIPPTFDPTIDAAGDLPGPGVEMMRVGMTLLPTVCGDGLVGIDESCDDGNNTSGDGCSATCEAVEICFTCVGDPSTCTRITTCTDGDGCCPAGCDSTTDDDCPRAVSCKQAKAKAAGKKAADLLKAFGKNEKNPNVPKLAQDISKAESKFTKRYSREESKGGCQTVDDTDALEAKVDSFVSDVIDEICLP